MNAKHILSSITLSLGLLGATSTWAQDAVKPAVPTEQTQAPRAERNHQRLTAEQIQDIGPVYEQLKKDGYTKVGSIKQGRQGVVVTVVNTEGQVLRLKQEAGKTGFTVWEHKKDDRRQRRHHRKDKPQQSPEHANQS